MYRHQQNIQHPSGITDFLPFLVSIFIAYRILIHQPYITNVHLAPTYTDIGYLRISYIFNDPFDTLKKNLFTKGILAFFLNKVHTFKFVYPLAYQTFKSVYLLAYQNECYSYLRFVTCSKGLQ